MPDRWDAVISRLGLTFTPDLAAALAGARRVLRVDVVEPVPASRRHASVAEAITAERDSRPLARVRAHLDDATRAVVWPGIERAPRVRNARGRGVSGKVLAGAATK